MPWEGVWPCLYLLVQLGSLELCEGINVSLLSHPVCDNLSQQPQESNPTSLNLRFLTCKLETVTLSCRGITHGLTRCQGSHLIKSKMFKSKGNFLLITEQLRSFSLFRILKIRKYSRCMMVVFLPQMQKPRCYTHCPKKVSKARMSELFEGSPHQDPQNPTQYLRYNRCSVNSKKMKEFFGHHSLDKFTHLVKERIQFRKREWQSLAIYPCKSSKPQPKPSHWWWGWCWSCSLNTS